MYTVELDPIAAEQAGSPPPTAINAFLELRALLELQPWNGLPLNPDNPKANMLTQTFGDAGMATLWRSIIGSRGLTCGYAAW